MNSPCKQCGKPVEKDTSRPRTLPRSRCDQCRGMGRRHKGRPSLTTSEHIRSRWRWAVEKMRSA